MVDPVTGGVFEKGNVIEIIFVDAIVQSEKNTQAGLREDCVCRLEEDVIAGDIPA
jgi:hypothetical protein